MTDPSDRKTPPEEDHEWAAIWESVRTSKRLQPLVPVAELITNWKAGLIGLAIAVWIGGDAFIERVVMFLSGMGS